MSIFDPFIERFNPEGKRVSFLFGGVGDSRHILRTIIEIAKHEGARRKLYHFTANDINNYAIIRDLIIWMLIQELSETTKDSDEATLIVNTLIFVYFGTMMPGRASKRLHQAIDEALAALKAGRQPLKWAHLYRKDFTMYVRVLTMCDEITRIRIVIVCAVWNRMNYLLDSVGRKSHIYTVSIALLPSSLVIWTASRLSSEV